nr:putative reverse transcriptase domain-containing protein [Tanacetum cinerariifolium]
MPPRMRTGSASRLVDESRGGGTSERVGISGRGRGPRGGNDKHVDELNGQGNDQGLGANGHEMQKLETELWNHAMFEAGHAAYTDRFHELARLVPHLVTPESRKIERNGSFTKVEKRENAGEPSKDKNGMDDNKRTRSGNAFASTTNPIGRESMGAWPKCTTCNSPTTHLEVLVAHASTVITWLIWKRIVEACRGILKENRPNHVATNNGGRGHGNQGNQARGRAFMLGVEETHQDPSIMTSMDWLSNHKAEIIFHEKVVRIPLLDGKVLRVLGERPEEKARLLMSVKASNKKQGEIVVVKYFLEVFLNDLLGLPPLQKIEFRVELIPVAVSIAKSPYRLAPSELEELSGQLKELQNKYFRGACRTHKVSLGTAQEGETKCKTFDWGEEQKLAFQTLKDKLCNAPVLALPDGPKDFVVYCDASRIGLGCVLMQRELFSDYDCEIRYHPGKANVVADALSRKERVKLKRVRALNMILQSSIKDRILTAQKEAVDESTRLQNGLNEMIEQRRTRLDMSTAYHPQTDGQSERTSQTLEDMLRACVLDFRGSWDVHLLLVEFSHNNSYHSSMRCASFKALYGRKCHSPIMWAEVGEGQLIGHELVQETTKKVSQIKDKLKAARDCHKSYADKRRKPLEFSVGDYVLLKVSP